jgi:predicted transcriptional regulator
VVMPTTTRDAVVNARLDSEILGQLDELAAGMQRTRSFLIAEAVREYVEREYAHLCAVREGDADAEAGRHLTGDEMAAWIEKLKAGRIKDSPAQPSRGGRKK